MGVKTIITTVGTSLITNFVYKSEHYDLRALGDKEEKEKSVSLKKEDYEDFRETLKDEGIIDDIKKFALKNYPNSSAELTSQKKLKEKYPNDNFIIYLLTSDTFEGYLVGEILKEVLEDENVKNQLKIKSVELSYIKNLRIDDTETFEKGLDSLIEEIYEIITKDKNKNISSEEVIFNITGGYKGVIPYISTIAQIFGYEIVYTFEDIEKENDLIKLEPLPLGFDENFTDLYLPFLFNEGLKILNEIDKIETQLEDIKKAKNPNIEKIKERENNLKNKEHLVNLKKILLKHNLIKKEGKLELTPLGKLVRLKTEDKKSKLGYIFEILLAKKLINENSNLNIKVSETYTVNGKNGEIDIFIENGNKIKAIEIKSLTKLYEKKGKEQIKKHIKYLQSLNKNYELEIIIYVLDELILNTDEFKNFVKNLKNISPDIKIKYFEYRPQKLDALIKNFDSEITLKEWKEGGNK